MRNRGYTLIELLVTIAVIAVLAGLLMPAMQRAKQSAQLTGCMHNMQQIGVAALNATHDNNNVVIGWYNYSTSKYWWQTLLPYLGSAGADSGARIFQCPADTHFDPNNMAQTLSYAWNYLVAGRSDTDVAPLNLLKAPNFIKPAETLMITDSSEPASWGYIDTYGHSPDPLRHNGKTSALFLDGHCQTLDVSAVSTADPYLDRSVVTH